MFAMDDIFEFASDRDVCPFEFELQDGNGDPIDSTSVLSINDDKL